MRYWQVILVNSVALFPLLVNAETMSSTPVNASTLLQTIFGLIVVLAIIVFLGWILKRSQFFHAAHNGQLKVLGSLSLGTREKAVLIQVGEQQLLIGVTAQNISTLHTLSEPLPIREISPPAEGESFADRLKQMMQQRGHK
ncbi:MAG TPA: flagellar biosynthetic protein FliO [Methylophaga sp.]|jgi:flagellar protein FliO/FliZ|uniref:flagellar biosynthetic protein FliO n=2 Tax=unclassified Methylophaga TaxID=2629249 RepID=UPI000C46AB9E|nr:MULTISPECIES: flagellar biosynthetic protein FliO [unclassified Methylophaga]MAP26251.1 flagellar biosynthetic protein FliO [Methylophaga sp.]MBP24640.1 flagellar biosynthetic protein FliO [Methylophaga sp.]HAD31998.1 flagellar biosynthetic protein FliO [Methylophaga sp.]HBX59667.1 flagellar biosynthetic protein FliO [Methylophaga sp.]HCC82181.1 flagellar biosynthetic protein FliO [Methylophaga sp.]|tara:strand:- start:420 stop:842 length:423 start_codon:yes stop_codon:yes gene_type:complete